MTSSYPDENVIPYLNFATTPNLILIRGLPGSGKSTIAQTMASRVHLEADMYFLVDGEYRFDRERIREAHDWCFAEAKANLLAGRNVMVANTFARMWELERYMELGYPTQIIEVRGDWPNVHGVHENAIAEMRRRWEGVPKEWSRKHPHWCGITTVLNKRPSDSCPKLWPGATSSVANKSARMETPSVGNKDDQEANIEARPREYMKWLANIDPQIWRKLDRYFASMRPSASNGLVTEDFATDAILDYIYDEKSPFRLATRYVSLVPIIATWRLTQGIYRFDPDVYADIATSEFEGVIPAQAFDLLPEWCVYIETPGALWHGEQIYGLFARVDWNRERSHKELDILLDCEDGYVLFQLPIEAGTIEDSLKRIAEGEDPDSDGRRKRVSENGSEIVYAKDIDLSTVSTVLNLLLYLCAENSDIGNGQVRPAKPVPKRTIRGERIVAPKTPRIWDVGVRIGASIRTDRVQNESSFSATDSLASRSPRPHVRRAHFHSYWTGRKDLSQERKIILRWIPATWVKVTSPNQLPATIRPVDRTEPHAIDMRLTKAQELLAESSLSQMDTRV